MFFLMKCIAFDIFSSGNINNLSKIVSMEDRKLKTI